ncbi:MAG: acyl-CoA dehydrogenase [Hyphomicrobiales bacterium]|nr:MAG: acyl-CoA dehydrogenase [Hyphomicrobiales bacterium]
MTYQAPIGEMYFTLNHIAGMKGALDAGLLGDLSGDLVAAILEEAGRFATDQIAPLNASADRAGSLLVDGVVSTAPGWKELYAAWIKGGWNAVTGPEDFDGQGLPIMVAAAVVDLWNQGSMAFAIGPTLTMGAVEALDKHATKELKDIWLNKLVTGEWMGTMNLTEPQAGSDLNAIRSKAVPKGDGTYRITGQKIFITYGDHDLTDNIVHLVLARLPDAPAGTRGISLFLAPKYLLNEDGSIGEPNDVRCVGLEHKLGIHASATCTMSFGDDGGAIGWLIGEENKGLQCMFTMMNNARLMVGLQGVGVAERATQQAMSYARDRRQGRGADSKDKSVMDPILVHPDVRRSLLTMKGLTRASRSICYACAHAIDMARNMEGDDAHHWQERAGLLTPVAKAFSTDCGFDVASMGVQIHGGMGYIEETGAAQHLRDARIAQIYEGTNGIQAIDLVMRKLPQSDGNCVRAYLSELKGIVHTLPDDHEDYAVIADRTLEALSDLEAATEWLLECHKSGDRGEVLAGATPYLRLFGLAAGLAYLAKGASIAPKIQDENAVKYRIQARFFAENCAPECASLLEVVTDGAATLCGESANIDHVLWEV